MRRITLSLAPPPRLSTDDALTSMQRQTGGALEVPEDRLQPRFVPESLDDHADVVGAPLEQPADRSPMSNCSKSQAMMITNRLPDKGLP